MRENERLAECSGEGLDNFSNGQTGALEPCLIHDESLITASEATSPPAACWPSPPELSRAGQQPVRLPPVVNWKMFFCLYVTGLTYCPGLEALVPKQEVVSASFQGSSLHVLYICIQVSSTIVCNGIVSQDRHPWPSFSPRRRPFSRAASHLRLPVGLCSSAAEAA